MPSPADAQAEPSVLVIGTGGTLAGQAERADDAVGYRSAVLGIETLVQAVPPLRGLPLRCLQLAQIDSKDGSHALWQSLVGTLATELAQPGGGGVVITHGTDTLEETAGFLQRVLAPQRPVVLTAAMRPATALLADGPQNLLDAVTVARHAPARGVLVVIGGRVYAGNAVRKLDAYRLDAFAGDEGGPVALVEEGQVRPLRPWPEGEPLGAAVVELPLPQWPHVAWLTSHAGFDGRWVDAAVASGLDGLVLAGTGNGTLHAALEAAAQRAQSRGVAVRLSTRCASGRVVGLVDRPFAVSTACSAAQARVELLLDLLQARAAAAA